MECEVKWALGSIAKASGDDAIPAELFQILKDDSVKVRHSICQQIWKTAVATGLEKVSFHSTSKERQCQRMLKLPHSCTHLTRQQSKARLQQYLNRELADVQEKAAEPEIKLPTFVGSWKKQENSRKRSTSVLLTMPKPLTV